MQQKVKFKTQQSKKLAAALRFHYTAQVMKRVCFLLKVKKNRLKEYKRRHKKVWPEMLAALRRTGWHNYSLFLRDDGLLVGYLETPNFRKALAGMAKEKINAKWQTEMALFFENIGGRHADQAMMTLEEVFHLE